MRIITHNVDLKFGMDTDFDNVDTDNMDLGLAPDSDCENDFYDDLRTISYAYIKRKCTLECTCLLAQAV